MDLTLGSSCPDRKTPASSERTPPAPSAAGPACPDHSQSLSWHGNTRGTANRGVPPKRRRASPPPGSSGGKRPGRWEPPRPSQEKSRGETRTPRPPAPSPAIEARGEGSSTHRAVSETHGPARQHPPHPGGGTQLSKPIREKWAGRSGRGLEIQRREEGRGESWAPTSDPAVRDVSRLSREERDQALQEAADAPALVLTMVHQDGSTQLCPKPVSLISLSGLE